MATAGFTDDVLALRLGRVNAQGGELQASLIWNDIADLDLHVVAPSGEEIYYGKKESQCGGWLDVDANASGPLTLEPVENVFWSSSPSGSYRVFVRNFRNHTNEQITDPMRVIPFRCILTRNGKSESFEGVCPPQTNVDCFKFDHSGSGACGSFVVLPPSDSPTTFEKSCQQHAVTYTKGAGYYAVARKEKIQSYKEMLLQHIATDTWTIGLKECRKLLDWPAEGELNMGPKDIKVGYRLFVQSTSANRVIPPGTHVLMKVSVRESLKHRTANTQFSNETHTMGQQTTVAATAPTAPAVATTTTTTATPVATPVAKPKAAAAKPKAAAAKPKAAAAKPKAAAAKPKAAAAKPKAAAAKPKAAKAKAAPVPKAAAKRKASEAVAVSAKKRKL